MESKKLYSTAPGSFDEDKNETHLEDEESLDDFDSDGSTFGFTKGVFDDFVDEEELDSNDDEDDEDAAYLDQSSSEDEEEEDIEQMDELPLDAFDIDPSDSDEDDFEL